MGRWCVTMTKTVPGIVLTLYHYFDGSCMPGESPWITNWVNLLRPSNLAAVKGRRPCEREPSILHLFSSIRFHVVGMRSTTAFSSAAFPTASSVWLLTEQTKAYVPNLCDTNLYLRCSQSVEIITYTSFPSPALWLQNGFMATQSLAFKFCGCVHSNPFNVADSLLFILFEYLPKFLRPPLLYPCPTRICWVWRTCTEVWRPLLLWPFTQHRAAAVTCRP